IVKQVLDAAGKKKSAVIGCLGLTYKANIDDIRESPAMEIVHQLEQIHPGRVLVSDPYVKEAKGISLIPWTKTVAEADILVLLVDHRDFLTLPIRRRRGQVII